MYFHHVLVVVVFWFPPLFPFSLSSPPFVQHTQRVRHDDDTNYVTHECFLCVLYKCACLVSQVVVVFVCLSPACFPFVVFSLSVAANNNNNNNPLDPKAPGPFFRFDLAKNRRQMEQHHTHVRTHTQHAHTHGWCQH